MSAKKLFRDVRRALEQHGFAVEDIDMSGKHPHVTVKHADGRKQRLTMSLTPTDTYITVNNVVRDARRFARGAYDI